MSSERLTNLNSRGRPAAEGTHPPRSMFGRLARDSAIYGGADLISKGIAFVTFPLIASALSPLAFGALELLMTVVALLGIAANCGLNNAVQRFYWDTPAAQRPVVISSGMSVLGSFLFIFLVAGLVTTAGLAPHLRTWNVPMTWIAPAAALVLMFSNQLAQYLLDVTRVQMRPWRFFGVSLVTRVASALAGLIGVVWLGFGIDGLLALQATVTLLILPLAALAVRQDLTFSIDRETASKLVRFGYPFVYSGIAFWLFGSIDRWLLAVMSSVEEVGVYSVAHRLASVVMMVSLAFGQAWAPLALKTHVDEPLRYRAFYADVLLLLACGMLILGGSIAIFSRELIDMLMPIEYEKAAWPLAILCLGVVLQSTTQVTALGISLEKKTSLFARLSWMTAGVNLVLNLLLIPKLGATGAALALTLSNLFLTAGYLYFSQLLHPMPIPWKRAFAWFAVLVCIGAVSSQQVVAPDGLASVWFKALIVVVCVGVCSALAFWRRRADALA